MKKWIEVKTIQFWSSEDGDCAGKIPQLHTIKVEEDCDDLFTEVIKELKLRNIHYNRIDSIKFV